MSRAGLRAVLLLVCAALLQAWAPAPERRPREQRRPPHPRAKSPPPLRR